MSATRENEVQQLIVTFTGNTTDGGRILMDDIPDNVFVSLTFDSGSMNWACTHVSVTTANVRVDPLPLHHLANQNRAMNDTVVSHQQPDLLQYTGPFFNHSQIVNFADSAPLREALESLPNIDNVTVTHDQAITVSDDSTGTLEVRYNITFDGYCVRGNIPTGDFTASCYASATSALADVDCR